jgi:hypothetical protein
LSKADRHYIILDGQQRTYVARSSLQTCVKEARLTWTSAVPNAHDLQLAAANTSKDDFLGPEAGLLSRRVESNLKIRSL